jgi:hypothetical protein
MVAKIAIAKAVSGALNYNENKVQKGKAECLEAANFRYEAKEMNFYQKLAEFESLNCLNDRATTNTLHVSLNFSPSERFSDNMLIEVANEYMEKIGFGEQPYLVYKHEDAGHPHIHIVSTVIKDDGKRINTHNIGRNQSEKARKEIEQKYGLVKAERQQQIITPKIRAVDIKKVEYGLQETKHGISNVVNIVFSQYKFTSLPEFNAALKQFNVFADRGKEGGRIYKNQGLVYRILDKDGNKVGVPIKASSLACKPTLDNLEKKFTNNQETKDSFKQRTKNAIEECFQNSPGTMKEFVTALEQKQIYTVLRQSADERLYGITFVDNQNKAVFNGSDLGKEFSATALQTRLRNQNKNSLEINVVKNESLSQSSKMEIRSRNQQDKKVETNFKKAGLFDILLTPKKQNDNTPFGFMKKKKSKKKRKIY